MELHTGATIRKILKEKGISIRRFSDEMAMSERNAQNFLNRGDNSLSQIIRASKILDVDLLKDYSQTAMGVLSDEKAEYKRQKNSCTISLSINGPIDDLSNALPEFLKLIQKEAILHGLRIQ